MLSSRSRPTPSGLKAKMMGKITTRPAASPLSGAEKVPLVQGGVTKQATSAAIAALGTAVGIEGAAVLDSIYSTLGAPNGGINIGRNRAPANFENRTIGEVLDDLPIGLFEDFTSAQVDAVRSKTAIAGLADRVNSTLALYGPLGRRVDAPSGCYDFRSSVIVPELASFKGEGASFPPGLYDPGFAYKTGTVFAKKHNGDAVSLVGSGPYAICGEIGGFAITSSRIDHPTGSGLLVNQVGSCRIREIKMFGIGGHCFEFGRSIGDVTGQLHVSDLYGNNPGQTVYYNRSKWIKMTMCEADGGTHSYVADNAPDGVVSMFHFEGASVIAAEFIGASKCHVLRDGFIGLTNTAATHAIKINSAAGNNFLTFDTIHITSGGWGIAVEIGASCWWTSHYNLTIENTDIGFLDNARGTSISRCKFSLCDVPVRTSGYEPRYNDCQFDATAGAYAIEFTAAGNLGHIIGCVTDKPFRPAPVAIVFTGALAAATNATLTGAFGGKTGPYLITFSDGSTRVAQLQFNSPAISWTGAVTAGTNASALNLFGDFGTTIIRDNSGFRTHARVKTQGAVPSGTAIAHTLATWPYTVFFSSESALPTDFAFTFDGTNVTPTWSGGGSFKLMMDAASACAFA